MTFRFVALLVSLLIIYPTFFAFFVQSSSFSDGLRTVFLLFKQPLLAVLAMVLFFLFAKSSLHNNPLSPNGGEGKGEGAVISLSRWREFLGFFIVGTLCLVLSSSTQIDLNQILNEGISIRNNKVHWDAQRWGGVPFLSEADPVGEQYLWVRSPGERVRKTIQITGTRDVGRREEIPDTHDPRLTTVLKWYGIWQDGNGNGVLDDAEQVWLEVNGTKYDVTEQYRQIPAGKPAILEVDIAQQDSPLPLREREGVRGFSLILEKTGASDSIGWVAQATYLSHQTAEWKPDPQQWQTAQFQEAMVWIAQPNPWYFSLLFKLGYCLRWLGMGLLFLAFLGRGWVMSVIRQSPWMAGVSVAYAPLILLLGLGIRESWPWLAQGVGWSLYGLLKLIPVGGKPFIRIPDGIHVDVGIERFWVNIADTCSGMESIGLFAGMYLGLILFNYRRFHLGRALALIVPGLVGTYVVNLVRIYVLFLAGLVWGNEVMNLFHTYLGMVLFVGFFLWFWRISQRWILSIPSPLMGEGQPALSGVEGGGGEKRVSLRTAPAVVSGLLVFMLLTGQEIVGHLKDGNAQCTGTAQATYNATGASCGPAYYIHNTIEIIQGCESGCSTRQSPTCTDGFCYPSGYGGPYAEPCYRGGNVNNPCLFSLMYKCKDGTFCYSYKTMVLSSYNNDCSAGCVPDYNSAPPTNGCGKYYSSGSFEQSNIPLTCVPEFPAFFPWLLSLLAPMLRLLHRK